MQTTYNGCFITKNNKELITKLEKIGYSKSSTYMGVLPYIWLSEGRIYESENVFLETVKIGDYTGPYGICCGDNEDLFISIAAQQNKTTTFYKWFKWNNPEDYHDGEDGLRQFIDNDSWQEWWWFEVDKATVKDILKHFKVY